MLKIGIAGASGRIGYEVAKRLKALRPDDEIIPIVRNSLADAAIRPVLPSVRQQDGNDPTKVYADLDVLINCARSTKAPNRDISANRMLTENLLDAFGGRLFIQLSSIAIYGDYYSRRFGNLERPRPNTVYGMSKLAVEQLCRQRASRESRVLGVRVGNVFGPEMNWSEVIFADCLSGTFRLPHDGKSDANCISVNALTSYLSRSIDTDDEMDSWLVENAIGLPRLTWRQLYDLHSEALEVPPVGSIGESDSRKIEQRLRSTLRQPAGLSAFRLAMSALKPSPMGRLARSYPFERAATNLLRFAPDRVVNRVIQHGKQGRRGSLHSQAINTTEQRPWLFSDAIEASTRLEDGLSQPIDQLRAELSEFASSFLPPPFPIFD